MEYFCIQVKQQDMGSQLQGGQELLLYLTIPSRGLGLKHDLSHLSYSSYLVSLIGLENCKCLCEVYQHNISPKLQWLF